MLEHGEIGYLILRGSTKINEINQVDLSSPENENRIYTELTPVLIEMKEILRESAEAIAANNNSKKEEILDRIKTIFDKKECPVTFDESNEYTNDDNPASIHIIDGNLKLMVSPQFENIINTVSTTDYLKELIHELGALLLIKQLEEEKGEIVNKQILDLYKNSLLLPMKYNPIGLTHLVDAVLLALIEDNIS